jgi:hypothetical protein
MQKAEEVEFVLPAGFRGPFVIVVAPDGQSCDSVDGLVSLSVPEARVVKIEDASILAESTPWRARFVGGSMLPNSWEARESDVSLHFGPHESQRHVRPHVQCFVGTEKEYSKCDFSELKSRISIDE